MNLRREWVSVRKGVNELSARRRREREWRMMEGLAGEKRFARRWEMVRRKGRARLRRLLAGHEGLGWRVGHSLSQWFCLQLGQGEGGGLGFWGDE